jgi:hypothetical protein
MKVKLFLVILAIILCVFALIITLSKYKLESETPQLSPVAVDVNINSNIAPRILAFANPTGTFAGPGGGPYLPAVNQFVSTRYSFLAEDLNGNQELPGTSTFPIQINAITSNIVSGYYAPLTAPNPTMIRTSSNCVRVECPAATTFPELGIICQTGATNYANQAVYICETLLEQTAPPGEWRPSLTITDSTGLTSTTITSGDPGFSQTVSYGNLKYILIGTLSLTGILSPHSLTWTGLTSTGTNQLSNIVTISNGAVNTFTITGSDLVGQNIPTSVLPMTAFRISAQSGGSPPAQCNSESSIQLMGSPQTIPSMTLPYTQAISMQTGTDTTTFSSCIPNTILSEITGTGGIDTNYKTVPSSNWDLVAI